MSKLTNIKRYVVLIRPHQWLKNLLILFPPFFGGKILDPAVLAAIIPSLLSFSLASSCGYIINDIFDREADRRHPTKMSRPVASGEISVILASVVAAVLYLAAILISSTVSRHFEGYVIIYILITFLYTLFLKNIVIVDIFVISFGFLIRVLAGGEAFNVKVSGWLFLAVFIVALFLSAGKRLGEFISLNDDAGAHRKSLSAYSSSYLEGILWFAASAAMVTYALYTLEHKDGLFYTVPLTVFGLLRYIYIVKQGRGDPTEALLFDGQIVCVGMIWVAMVGIIIYR